MSTKRLKYREDILNPGSGNVNPRVTHSPLFNCKQSQNSGYYRAKDNRETVTQGARMPAILINE
ncbi:MAG: hypothetical protein GY757_02630 [bacterium]|nr:hypothetical protein [bacterium]